MIYVKLEGGLGNQMFQLATAKALAIYKNTAVRLIIDQFSQEESEAYTKRFFELTNVFSFKGVKVATHSQHRYLTKNNLTSKIKRKVLNGSVYYESNLRYNPEINHITKNAYISGYFQSEKYFKQYRSNILDLFTFSKEISNKTNEALKEIERNNTIAIHIRRGDYVSKQKVNTIHGVLPISYYKKAIAKFEIEKYHLYFFSDDIEWVKKNLIMNNSIHVSYIDWNNGNDSWQDIYLMSKCKHFIIANSSFSWWGAWLSTNKNKKVIAPKLWYKDKIKNNLTNDLIPETWQRL